MIHKDDALLGMTALLQCLHLQDSKNIQLSQLQVLLLLRKLQIAE